MRGGVQHVHASVNDPLPITIPLRLGKWSTFHYSEVTLNLVIIVSWESTLGALP